MATQSPHADGANGRPSDRRGFTKPTEQTMTAAASPLVLWSHGSTVPTTQFEDKERINSDTVAPRSSEQPESESGMTGIDVRASGTATVGGA